jgi:hypothetical protein
MAMAPDSRALDGPVRRVYQDEPAAQILHPSTGHAKPGRTTTNHCQQVRHCRRNHCCLQAELLIRGRNSLPLTVRFRSADV